jgi:hypothetical protein
MYVFQDKKQENKNRLENKARRCDQAVRFNQILGRQISPVGTGPSRRAIFDHCDRLARFGCMKGCGECR